jgi:hypothetical protein
MMEMEQTEVAYAQPQMKTEVGSAHPQVQTEVAAAQPQVQTEEALRDVVDSLATATAAAAAAVMEVIPYSEKAIAVVGDTRAFAAAFKSSGGRFNRALRVGEERVAGWIFPATKRGKVDELVNTLRKVSTNNSGSSVQAAPAAVEAIAGTPPVLIKYSEKAIALFGVVPKDKSLQLSENHGGRYSAALTHPETGTRMAGWIFGHKRQAEVERLFRIEMKGAEGAAAGMAAPAGSKPNKSKKGDKAKKAAKVDSATGKPKAKQVPSAYILYMQATAAQLLAEHPNFSFAERGAEVGRRWRALTNDEKAVYARQRVAAVLAVKAATEGSVTPAALCAEKVLEGVEAVECTGTFLPTVETEGELEW